MIWSSSESVLALKPVPIGANAHHNGETEAPQKTEIKT